MYGFYVGYLLSFIMCMQNIFLIWPDGCDWPTTTCTPLELTLHKSCLFYKEIYTRLSKFSVAWMEVGIKENMIMALLVWYDVVGTWRRGRFSPWRRQAMDVAFCKDPKCVGDLKRGWEDGLKHADALFITFACIALMQYNNMSYSCWSNHALCPMPRLDVMSPLVDCIFVWCMRICHDSTCFIMKYAIYLKRHCI